MMKRIGLTQRVEIVQEYEERRDCLDQRWSKTLLDLGYCPIPLANLDLNTDKYVNALSLDGLILTGGNDINESASATNTAPERDRFEHSLLDYAEERCLPVVAICRGLQLLNIHHGGTIVRVENHAGERHRVNLDPEFFQTCPLSILTNSYHGFAIEQLPSAGSLQPMAWADDGTIEAVTHQSLPQFGIMWHPEREQSLALHDSLILRTAFGQSLA